MLFKENYAMFLMNEKGHYCLDKYIEDFGTKNVQYVVSSPDQNVEKDYYNEIKELCKKENILFYHRNEAPTINDETVIAIGWRWIINGKKVIVFHDSLLPKYRGFNPLVTALINGDSKTGVTALLATEQYDEGPIAGFEVLKIEYPAKIQKIIEDIKKLYYVLLKNVVSEISSTGYLELKKQNNDEATYSLWRDEEDYFIDWTKSAAEIKRFVDAVGSPYKGAASMLDGEVVRILDVEVMDDVTIENRSVGKVIFLHKKLPVIVCGTGLLILKKVVNCKNQNVLPFNKLRVRLK